MNRNMTSSWQVVYIPAGSTSEYFTDAQLLNPHSSLIDIQHGISSNVTSFGWVI